MKKLLLSTAAVGLAMTAMPAHAQVNLDLGGHLKGYVVVGDQGGNTNDFDILRETEIHFTGETTLDNGLTVGAHVEADTDGSDAFAVDESYAYFAGSWGRVNFGNEDGAAYLLQVAAPSADSNVDGLRQYVAAENYGATSLTAGQQGILAGGLDYDNDFTGNEEKVTYLSPIYGGFQFGASYTPDSDTTTNSLGVGLDNQAGAYGDGYELAARYEGDFDGVGVIAGAGFSETSREVTAAGQDDFTEWNVGLDLDVGAFGIGAVYTENNSGLTGANDEYETMVVGVDYTTGAYKLGASWLNNENNLDGAGAEVETDRYSAGVTYSYGPGMSFRGSVHQVDHEVTGGTDIDSTSVLLGTQINF